MAQKKGKKKEKAEEGKEGKKKEKEEEEDSEDEWEEAEEYIRVNVGGGIENIWITKNQLIWAECRGQFFSQVSRATQRVA